MVYHENIVVGKWTTSKIKCPVLNELTIDGGFTPSSHHGALHLNEVWQHVDFDQSGLNLTLSAKIGKFLVLAHSIGDAFDLFERICLRSSDEFFLLVVDERQSTFSQMNGVVGQWRKHFLFNDVFEYVWHPFGKILVEFHHFKSNVAIDSVKRKVIDLVAEETTLCNTSFICIAIKVKDPKLSAIISYGVE